MALHNVGRLFHSQAVAKPIAGPIKPALHDPRNPEGATLLPRILRWRLSERVGCILCDTAVDQD